jgi:hypothetical protein
VYKEKRQKERRKGIKEERNKQLSDKRWEYACVGINKGMCVNRKM